MKIVKTVNDIEIHYPLAVYQKIMHWVKKSNYEVSGFGNVKYDKKNKIFTVVDAFLVKQQNTSASTTTDEADLGKLMYEQDKAFGDGSVKLWWHSHADMNVFWSGTDLDTIKKYGGNGYIVATVFNKKEEMRSAVCFQTQHPMFGKAVTMVDDIATFALYPQEWDDVYDEKVQVSTNIDRTNQKWDYVNKCWVDKEKTKDNSETSPAPQQLIFTDDVPINKYPHGILGRGLEVEAEALRMTYVAYENLLATGTEEELEQKEEDLTMLEAAGYFEADEMDELPTNVSGYKGEHNA